MRKHKLFIITSLVLLAVILGMSSFVWFIQDSFGEHYPFWFVWGVQPSILFVALGLINWTWTWNREWKDFYW